MAAIPLPATATSSPASEAPGDQEPCSGDEQGDALSTNTIFKHAELTTMENDLVKKRDALAKEMHATTKTLKNVRQKKRRYKDKAGHYNRAALLHFVELHDEAEAKRAAKKVARAIAMNGG